MDLVVLILVLLMLIAAIAAAIFKDLMNAVIASCVVSLIAAILFYFHQAPDVAMAEAAISSGLRYFGGYPITPSTEVIEHLAVRLPQVGGVCMQMEDELASINSVIGASLVGAKSMTATSGPGLALMVETISMAANLEVPFVFYDVQRNGPGTGFVTEPHHNDIGLVRFSGNGEFQL